MALTHSKYVQGVKRIPAPCTGGEVVAIRYEIPLTVAIVEAVDDIVEVGVLPHYCRVVDAILDTEDLDDGVTGAIDVGLMSGSVGEALNDDDTTRTIGAEIFAAESIQAAAVIRASLPGAFQIAPVGYDRSIGLKIETASTTGNAGTVGITIMFEACP